MANETRMTLSVTGFYHPEMIKSTTAPEVSYPSKQSAKVSTFEFALVAAMYEAVHPAKQVSV